MTIARKYIRQCRTLFPVYGKSERTFLNRLKAFRLISRFKL